MTPSCSTTRTMLMIEREEFSSGDSSKDLQGSRHCRWRETMSKDYTMKTTRQWNASSSNARHSVWSRTDRGASLTAHAWTVDRSNSSSSRSVAVAVVRRLGNANDQIQDWTDMSRDDHDSFHWKDPLCRRVEYFQDHSRTMYRCLTTVVQERSTRVWSNSKNTSPVGRVPSLAMFDRWDRCWQYCSPWRWWQTHATRIHEVDCSIEQWNLSSLNRGRNWIRDDLVSRGLTHVQDWSSVTVELFGSTDGVWNRARIAIESLRDAKWEHATKAVSLSSSSLHRRDSQPLSHVCRRDNSLSTRWPPSTGIGIEHFSEFLWQRPIVEHSAVHWNGCPSADISRSVIDRVSTGNYFLLSKWRSMTTASNRTNAVDWNRFDERDVWIDAATGPAAIDGLRSIWSIDRVDAQ